MVAMSPKRSSYSVGRKLGPRWSCLTGAPILEPIGRLSASTSLSHTTSLARFRRLRRRGYILLRGQQAIRQVQQCAGEDHKYRRKNEEPPRPAE